MMHPISMGSRSAAVKLARLAAGAVAVAALALGAAAAGPAEAAAPAGGLGADEARLLQLRRQIEGSLICQCGCTMVVSVCECGTAEQMRADIIAQLRAGASPDAILARYVTRYGKEILAAPTKRGFDLTAWITPFAALAAGGGALFYLLRRWAPRRGSHRAEQGSGQVGLSAEERVHYEVLLEEELRKYY